MRTALVVAAAFGLGIGLTVALSGRDDDGNGGGQASAGTDPTQATATTSRSETAVSAPARSRSADSPEAAVRAFLDAEVAGEFEAAFDFLGDELRAALGSPAGYVAQHASLVPPVLGYEVEAVEGPTVRTLVRYEPSLDSVVGLVPAEALVTWAVEEGDGAFGVDLEATTSEPRYPSDDTAPAAVESWAEARRSCSATGEQAGEWEGGLLGTPVLAERLCEAEGEVAVGEPGGLGPSEGAPFSAAFGDDVSEWSRVVPVESPEALRAVVAPVGPDWVVVGVLPAGPGAGL